VGRGGVSHHKWRAIMGGTMATKALGDLDDKLHGKRWRQ